MKLPKFETALVVVIGLGMFLPILITLFSGVLVSDDWQKENVMIHSLLELSGAVIALLLVGILFFKNKKTSLIPVWIICAFLSLGIFDFVHALTKQNNNFVWLHSLAVFFGGLFFSMLWLPTFRNAKDNKSIFRIIISSTILLLLGIVFLSLLYPLLVPLMTATGNFTAFSKFLNISGGVLFFLAMLYFINEYSQKNSWTMLILSILCSLFGAAGILFAFSALWDINWWVWHILRIAAYFFTLILILKDPTKNNLFREEQK